MPPKTYPPQNPYTEVPHGTVTRYANYGCHCDECRAANQLARVRLRDDPNRERCQEEGCFDPLYQRGWCSHHFYSWRKYGDPLASKRRFKPPYLAHEGMKWCTGCRLEMDVSWFSKDVTRKDGLQRLCKPCSRIAVQATLYGMSPEEVVAKLSQGCAVCGTLDDLEMDHDHDCCSGVKSCGKCVRDVLCGRHNRAEGMLRSRSEVVALLAYGDKWNSWVDTD